MRPTTNFTLHAMLAAMLVAFAASSAAAQSDTHLALGDSIPAMSKDGKRGDWIEIQSWQWSDAAKIDSFTVKQGVKPVASTGGVSVAAGDVNDSSGVGASEKVTVDGTRTQSGQATGKRQHLPLRMRTYYDQPLAKGSVWVRVASPWTACRVGARYPTLELGSKAKRYILQDAVVASCGGSSAQDDRPTEEVAFYYNKVSVRGWDPKKKEQ